ncbi:MAG: hypothetical protein Q8R37_03010 [Nanoarchaeota archaeon]|nr:hypothetical protein [Nanoarchaeota archaeon]
MITTEHSGTITAEMPIAVHKKMDVFYNPIMASNRNLSILLLNSVSNTKMNIALPLAGSGIRAIRFLQELQQGKINHLFVNDIKDNFLTTFAENMDLNPKITPAMKKKVTLGNEDASLFLVNQVTNNHKPDRFCGFFDYIDLDPFGSPNPFLSAAIARISRNGIIAVTATDTAALTGTYPAVTKRKYWARTVRNYMMHEIGLRILIRKIQLQGVQFDRALIPILSYHKDHYFRIYFRCIKSKEKSDQVLKQHQYLLCNPKTLEFEISDFNFKKGCDYFGPLWTGRLFDHTLITTMARENPFPEEQKWLDLLKEEAKVDLPGFYDLHVLAKKYKTEPPRMEKILSTLNAVRTHFSLYGIKTEKNIKDVSTVLLS